MQFETKIFVKVGNPGARISDFGGLLFVLSILFIVVGKFFKLDDSYGLISLCGIGASGIALIVGRIMTKGNMLDVGLSDTELVVADDGIRIGTEWYALDQISNLDFMIEGYDGQPTVRYGRVFTRTRGRGLSGVNNKIHFRTAGKRHLYQFYLRSRLDMQQLGQVFRVFYERRVPFGECNRGGPTFLFQQVRSRKQFEEMKKKAGYYSHP